MRLYMYSSLCETHYSGLKANARLQEQPVRKFTCRKSGSQVLARSRVFLGCPTNDVTNAVVRELRRTPGIVLLAVVL